MLLDSITVLPVDDIEMARMWYREILGFETLFLNTADEPGEVTNYAVLKRDAVLLHLILDERSREFPWAKSGTGYLYLRVRDAEEFENEVKSRGAVPSRGLQVEPWGNPAFNLIDPGGNSIHIESWE